MTDLCESASASSIREEPEGICELRKDSAYGSPRGLSSLYGKDQHRGDSSILSSPQANEIETPVSFPLRSSSLSPAQRSANYQCKDTDIGLIKTHSLPESIRFVPFRDDNFVFHFPLPPSATIQGKGAIDVASPQSTADIGASLLTCEIPSIRASPEGHLSDSIHSKALPPPPSPQPIKSPKKILGPQRVAHNRRDALENIEQLQNKHRPESPGIPARTSEKLRLDFQGTIEVQDRKRESLDDDGVSQAEELSHAVLLTQGLVARAQRTAF